MVRPIKIPFVSVGTQTNDVDIHEKPAYNNIYGQIKLIENTIIFKNIEIINTNEKCLDGCFISTQTDGLAMLPEVYENPSFSEPRENKRR
ncbi:unnamed protein product, partial [Bubo scandiacus]